MRLEHITSAQHNVNIVMIRAHSMNLSTHQPEPDRSYAVESHTHHCVIDIHHFYQCPAPPPPPQGIVVGAWLLPHTDPWWNCEFNFMLPAGAPTKPCPSP